MLETASIFFFSAYQFISLMVRPEWPITYASFLLLTSMVTVGKIGARGLVIVCALIILSIPFALHLIGILEYRGHFNETYKIFGTFILLWCTFGCAALIFFWIVNWLPPFPEHRVARFAIIGLPITVACTTNPIFLSHSEGVGYHAVEYTGAFNQWTAVSAVMLIKFALMLIVPACSAYVFYWTTNIVLRKCIGFFLMSACLFTLPNIIDHLMSLFGIWNFTTRFSRFFFPFLFS